MKHMQNCTRITLPVGTNNLLLPRFGARALVVIPVVLLFLLAAAGTSFAGSATWKAAPATGDWNTAANWTPATVPNSSTDTATFATSNITGVSLSNLIQLNAIVFNTGASAFTITDNAFQFTISGTGIMNNSAATQNFVVGVNGVGGFGTLDFQNSATAATATITTAAPAETAGQGGIVNFRNSSTADHATIINNGSSFTMTVGGTAAFWDTSSAGNSAITNNGGNVVGGGGGVTLFISSATAAAATLTCNAGAGHNGASIQFKQSTTGGTARIKLSGNGELLISEHNPPGMTTGSIEGNGEVFLGANNLTVGANNLSTTFSGIIQDGDEGFGGSLTKIGTGTLTLSGANTYTGSTTVTTGTLLVSNRHNSGTGTGPVNVNVGTLGGKGTIAGSVAVGTGSGPGAFLAPGVRATPGTLTIQGPVTFNSDSTYTVDLNTTRRTADKAAANGVTINSNAHFSFMPVGNGTLPLGTVFTIIDNTTATAITGVFTNLPNGSIITAGSNRLQVNYQGGDGNNLTLTVVP
jgi:autotransporter-associated beta strand protein